jgi:Ras GTPase-activating-like protein IQGAP2/3
MILDIEQSGSELKLPRAVTVEEATANNEVQTIILPRIATLMAIASSFMTAMIASIEHVPYGIRWICKQIKSLTKVNAF